MTSPNPCLEAFLVDHADHQLARNPQWLECQDCWEGYALRAWGEDDELGAYEVAWGEGYGRMLAARNPPLADRVEQGMHQVLCVPDLDCRCATPQPIVIEGNGPSRRDVLLGLLLIVVAYALVALLAWWVL